ncbi:MAG TPA: translesion error-prone DNA polymerase V autoproteolytic subunit [Flavobacterium sp.]|nr:translesion error-prone DNA polymerase V autoproteolytic subunit [Flavobacterium sp.]
MPIKTKLEFFLPDLSSEMEVDFADVGISAGFPSPALDFMKTRIDINKLLNLNPLTTFFAKASGDSMIGAGILDNAFLVIDRSLPPQDKKIAICFIDGEFTVKRLKVDKKGISLLAENDKYKPIAVTEDNHFVVWGIVTHVINAL